MSRADDIALIYCGAVDDFVKINYFLSQLVLICISLILSDYFPISMHAFAGTNCLGFISGHVLVIKELKSYKCTAVVWRKRTTLN